MTARGKNDRLGATIAVAIIAIIWTIPTFGLLVTSFRPEVDIKSTGWWTFFENPVVTLQNYADVLFGSTTALSGYFINSIVIVIPAVLLPILLAAIAAYGLSWIRFRGVGLIFLVIFAIQVVPIQVALIPLLQMFVSLNIAGSFWALWIAHTIFALPLAIYILHNFISRLPTELMEAARIDGATHVTVFLRIVLPLAMPAIAAFGVFQFLWVWNDLLVGLSFAGGAPAVAPLTVRLQQLSGTNGTEWQLLSSGAFISIIVPVVVFIALQRFFVRGLLAGSVKS